MVAVALGPEPGWEVSYTCVNFMPSFLFALGCDLSNCKNLLYD